MTAIELFEAGRLQEAIQALGEEVRNAPLDTRRRTFLFELLAFAGEYDRAEKHLHVLTESSQSAALGALLYRSALHAERTRQQMFLTRSYPASRATQTADGKHDGRLVESFCDADERIGASLEIFVAGSYTWIALEQIASIEVPRPKRLRDLLWTPATVTPRTAYSSMELGEVLLPVLYPLSWKHQDDSVRLGRTTIWEESGDEAGSLTPFGQKIFSIDGQDVPILELGRVEFNTESGEERAASA
jgi:type VI secretion system protein ImpE